MQWTTPTVRQREHGALLPAVVPRVSAPIARVIYVALDARSC